MTTDTTRAHCNQCLGKRNHEVLFKLQFEEDGGEEEPGFYTKHELLKCLGCEQITYRMSEWNDMECDENGNYIIKTQYYPPAIFRSYPIWFSELEHLGYMEKIKKNDTEYLYIFKLLQEIYIGLQSGSIRLSTMGIRALLESIMIHKVSDNGSFKKNLDEFEKQGYISHSQKSILNTVLETGHATIHRAYSPSKKDLTSCMDIAENLIATIYIHTNDAMRLSKKIPSRK
jgi:hypothetical protein